MGEQGIKHRFMIVTHYELTLVPDPPPGGVRLVAIKELERLVDERPTFVLYYFLKLGTPAHLKRFIGKCGPLGFCEHGNPQQECTCKDDAKQRVSDRMRVGLPPFPEEEWLTQPIELVRDYANLAKTFSDIIQTGDLVLHHVMRHQRERTSWERWVRIRDKDAKAMKRLTTWMQDYNMIYQYKLARTPAPKPEDVPDLPAHIVRAFADPVIDYPLPRTEPQARQLVVDALERVLSWGNFQHRFEWRPPPSYPKRFAEPADLWGTLGVGLAENVCGGQRLASCQGCGGTFPPVEIGVVHRGRPRLYCDECNKNHVRQNKANRTWRDKRDKKKAKQ